MGAKYFCLPINIHELCSGIQSCCKKQYDLFLVLDARFLSQDDSSIYFRASLTTMEAKLFRMLYLMGNKFRVCFFTSAVPKSRVTLPYMRLEEDCFSNPFRCSFSSLFLIFFLIYLYWSVVIWSTERDYPQTLDLSPFLSPFLLVSLFSSWLLVFHSDYASHLGLPGFPDLSLSLGMSLTSYYRLDTPPGLKMGQL